MLGWFQIWNPQAKGTSSVHCPQSPCLLYPVRVSAADAAITSNQYLTNYLQSVILPKTSRRRPPAALLQSNEVSFIEPAVAQEDIPSRGLGSLPVRGAACMVWGMSWMVLEGMQEVRTCSGLDTVKRQAPSTMGSLFRR